MPDLPTLEKELALSRHDVRNLQIIQLRQGLSAALQEVLKEMERLAREEVKLRLKAIEQAKAGPSRLRRWLTIIPRSLGN